MLWTADVEQIALEGLEDYDPATHGDLRRVDSVGEHFVYLKRIRGWVQMEDIEHSVPTD